ncbi:unnamed protein product [Cylindrotheca closterium]|uniref:Uncharacterized protein n=1 Tax=Cylindrotheca closterium TaxID=2856 RepID=A0AAD2CDK0_9STRA|nr:unnamed protein product [Cylindrotheca closterium]
MSNLPLFQKQEGKSSYGSANGTTADEETGPLLLVATTSSARTIGDVEVAETILALFLHSDRRHELNRHPKTNPNRPPEKRFKRHRNYYVWQLNQFRHWWKTSRLLVRLSGGYEYCLNPVNWIAMGSYAVQKRKQGKRAVRSMKAIGRGGVSRDFLTNVKLGTRSIRLILAIARGYEARRDHRLVEVGMAEAFAFMGNRSFRWFARHFVDESTKQVFLPFSAIYIAPYLDQNSRPVIVTLGFLRAILSFAVSFLGSRFGRQLTYSTYNVTHNRWKAVQGIEQFHPNAGAFQDTVLDQELLEFGHQVAEAIGHGAVPEETRSKLLSIGFLVVGSGQGGYACYRRLEPDRSVAIFLHLTPYGPSILGEMPRYVVLERKKIERGTQHSDVTIMDAAVEPEESIYGYTYSGAFFKNQEWAALRLRYDDTLTAYKTACNRLKTSWSLRGKNAINTPPSSLMTLKDFIRSGHTPMKARKDKHRWKELAKQVKKMSALVAKYQKQGKAPKRVILYLEGLDCTAKSSTGGLICSALEDCGYVVRTAQHNRPPTPEQRQKPWMDRGRFEYPEDVYKEEERVPEYTALVWDRGPAGDFVYGNFSELNEKDRMKKYDEFRQYDAKCREEGVLLFKLLFVADKDSIAATLGKRLAHKHIVKDLHTWLDANSVEHFREGLEAIERHIDPTDFVAFNKYERNLHVFTEFARNTDKMGPIGPWTVVNTCKRHPARLRLLQTFERELKKFANRDYEDVPIHPMKIMISGKDDPVHPVSIRAMIQIILLFWVIWFYADITWKVDIMRIMEE